MVAHLKLLIAKLKHNRFSASFACGRKLLDQLELELEELKAETAENAVSDDANADTLNDIDPRARSTNVATDGMNELREGYKSREPALESAARVHSVKAYNGI
jgi:hypothetical protein